MSLWRRPNRAWGKDVSPCGPTGGRSLFHSADHQCFFSDSGEASARGRVTCGCAPLHLATLAREARGARAR
eukprot:2277192-Alexandrium_andersonii.AAC.1